MNLITQFFAGSQYESFHSFRAFSLQAKKNWWRIWENYNRQSIEKLTWLLMIIFWINGMTKAPVLPDPVLPLIRTSLPFKSKGIAFSWIAVGSSQPSLAIAWKWIWLSFRDKIHHEKKETDSLSEYGRRFPIHEIECVRQLTSMDVQKPWLMDDTKTLWLFTSLGIQFHQTNWNSSLISTFYFKNLWIGIIFEKYVSHQFACASPSPLFFKNTLINRQDLF